MSASRITLSWRRIAVPFRVTFRHASAARTETTAVLVTACDDLGNYGFGEGCPRDYVTGETLESAEALFREYRDIWCRELADLAALRDWITGHRQVIDRNPAAWCAVELALLDLFARQNEQPVEALLGLELLSGEFRFTAVIGDAGTEQVRLWFTRYRELGFHDFKLKLSGDNPRDRDKVAIFRAKDAKTLRLRADANNLWRDSTTAIETLRALDYPFFAIEEPLARGDYAGLRAVADVLETRIVLDESLVRLAQLKEIAPGDKRFIANLRVSKMGGLLRSLEIVEAARQHGIPLIVGAQVGETSLLTRAALTVAHAARDFLVAQEGAFGTLLLERDIFTPTLMFGAGGILDSRQYRLREMPGWGIRPEDL